MNPKKRHRIIPTYLSALYASSPKCALKKVNRATKPDDDANVRDEFGPQLHLFT